MTFTPSDPLFGQYSDLEAHGITSETAYAHYLGYGAVEGRAPNAFFDSAWYLAGNRDVTDAGANPLEHFLRFGIAEGRVAYGVSDFVIV